MSTDSLRDLRLAQQQLQMSGTSGYNAREALRSALTALLGTPGVPNWGHQNTDFRVVEEALNVISALVAWVTWARGNGNQPNQVDPAHRDLGRDILKQVEMMLRRMRLHPDLLEKENYSRELGKLYAFSSGTTVRLGESFNNDEAREFLERNWPKALHDLSRAIKEGVVPSDPPGSDSGYRFQRLAAMFAPGGEIAIASERSSSASS